MLSHSKIISFVATANVGQSRLFYEDILGLRLIADEPFALVFEAGGVDLRIQKVQGFTPQQFTVLGWMVQDITDSVTELKRKGVGFETFPGLVQDELGICVFPDGAKVAWFTDPDANLLSLTQASPT